MEFQPFLVYSASAGSGKTFALSLRYISLLFLGESPSNILATTFTRKAASQMQTRIRDYLLNLEKERDFLELLSREIGKSIDEILQSKQKVLSQFLSSPNHIVTIDSFISSILRTNALEIGLEPSFSSIDKVDIQEEFLNIIYSEGFLDNFVELTILMDIQKEHPSIEIMDKLFNLDPLLPSSPKAGQKDIKEIELEIDRLRERNFQILKETKGASNSAIKNFAPETLEKFYKKNLFSKESLYEHGYYKRFLHQIPELEENFQKIKALIKEWFQEKENHILSKMFELYSYYKNSKIAKAKSTNILSFSDVSYFVYRLLHKSINKDFLYFKLDSKFRHILLDEFQDTSTLQFLIFKPLIDEIFSGAGGQEFRSFFYVGDPKQSLYRFRGGQEELFEWVANYYQIPIKNLDTNYRSHRLIVESVNRWFEETMPNYTPQKPYAKSDGYVKILESEQENLISQAIKEAKNLIKKGVAPSSIAFLVFTNNEGVTLQNLSSKESLPTILQTSSKLNRLSKVLALVQGCEYLYRGYKIDIFNLLLRVGKSPRDVDFEWFSPKLRPVEVIDRLIREFDYFGDEVNILNLLEFASGFDEIGEFLDEFENSRLPIATKSKYGSTIMTIHSSKGLEFDYVIILDRTKNEGNDTEKLLAEYDENLYIKRFFYRFKDRKNFDDEYAKLLEDRDSLRQKDRLNTLYVALTRAKKGLIVVKNSKKSIFEQELGINVFEIGEIEEEQKSQKDIQEIHYPKIKERYGMQEQNVQEEEIEREYDYYATLFGSALHYTLEVLGKFDSQALELAVESTKNRFGAILSTEEIEEIETRVLHLINHQEFQKMIKNRKIKKEQPLSFEGKLYQIDLLLESDDEIIVVDYKSSPKEFYKHKKQVANYCKIVSKLTQKKARGLICYLLSDEVFFKDI